MYYSGFFLKEIIDILVTENLPNEVRIIRKGWQILSFLERSGGKGRRWVGLVSLSLRINKKNYIFIFYLPLSGKISL